jgi:hypothetical protein
MVQVNRVLKRELKKIKFLSLSTSCLMKLLQWYVEELLENFTGNCKNQAHELKSQIGKIWACNWPNFLLKSTHNEIGNLWEKLQIYG